MVRCRSIAKPSKSCHRPSLKDPLSLLDTRPQSSTFLSHYHISSARMADTRVRLSIFIRSRANNGKKICFIPTSRPRSLVLSRVLLKHSIQKRTLYSSITALVETLAPLCPSNYTLHACLLIITLRLELPCSCSQDWGAWHQLDHTHCYPPRPRQDSLVYPGVSTGHLPSPCY